MYLAIFLARWRTNKQTNNWVILLQAASWPVERQSFVIITWRKSRQLPIQRHIQVPSCENVASDLLSNFLPPLQGNPCPCGVGTIHGHRQVLIISVETIIRCQGSGGIKTFIIWRRPDQRVLICKVHPGGKGNKKRTHYHVFFNLFRQRTIFVPFASTAAVLSQCYRASQHDELIVCLGDQPYSWALLLCPFFFSHPLVRPPR